MHPGWKISHGSPPPQDEGRQIEPRSTREVYHQVQDIQAQIERYIGRFDQQHPLRTTPDQLRQWLVQLPPLHAIVVAMDPRFSVRLLGPLPCRCHGLLE